jgi:hypothetical protein
MYPLLCLEHTINTSPGPNAALFVFSAEPVESRRNVYDERITLLKQNGFLLKMFTKIHLFSAIS